MHKGVNIADIEIIVQWRMSCDMNTLWQHFGCAACNLSLQTITILLVKSKYLDLRSI
ncbi:hypothetical protein BKA93DRAFT_740037 [Sparassis latifolia]